jgi:rhamnogalacturonyl hydrolase YesR
MFTLGMAWGVGAGLLDAATYWPVVERAWNGLLTAIDDDGAVNFVQPIGDEPKKFDPHSHAPFGTGAVLGAGAYILRTLDANPRLDRAELLDEADALADKAPDLSSVCDEPCEPPSGN